MIAKTTDIGCDACLRWFDGYGGIADTSATDVRKLARSAGWVTRPHRRNRNQIDLCPQCKETH